MSPSPFSVKRALAAVGTTALVAGGLAAAPTAAATTTATSITVLLKAPHQARLNRLALAHGLSHAQRVAKLAPLLPSAAAHATVVKSLEARGFTITHQTAWTIDATAPTQRVRAAFGTTSASVAPTIPSAISDVTAAVLPKSTAPAIFHPRDLCSGQCHDGQDFRNAYSSTKKVLHKGHDDNGALTIATLQFPLGGGWNPSDLKNYAASVGLPDPTNNGQLNGQYKQIPVDSATIPAATKAEQGADEEVDLDQESILSTAPLANQRAYFDTSATKAAYTDALSQVLADVTVGTGAYNGGDPKIAALSTSWGSCETNFSSPFGFPDDTVKGVSNVLKSLTAAGVTIFAATGDDGVYDCAGGPRSTQIAVDYPASSPQVVAVGGTRLKYIGNSAANDGLNWIDTAWTCHDAETCQGNKAKDTGGSGGGESTMFRMPAYQSLGIGSQPFKTTTGKEGNFGTEPNRLLPDIAADGDPASGFKVLTSDPVDVPSCAPILGGLPNPACKPKSLAIGGTSLSAPASAALFVDMLADHNVTAGVGDIHAALYSAYAAHHNVFRDITKGSNGNQKDVDKHSNSRSAELPVNAQQGYDSVTGLGATLWPALAPYLFNPVAPTAKAAMTLATPHDRQHFDDVTASWRGQLVKSNGSLPASAAVTITRNGSTSPVYEKTSAPAAGGHVYKGTAGATYTISVTETSLSGATSSPVTGLITIPYDDKKFTYHGPWKEVAGATDFGGTRKVVDKAGAYAKVTATASTYTLVARTGPDQGKIAVFRGATKAGTYDLYSKHASHTAITFYGTPTTASKSRTFKIYATGRKNSKSSSTQVNVDALVAVPGVS